MIKYAFILMVQLCTGTALACAMTGFAWIDKGYGMHPMLAGALVTMFLLIPFLVAKRVLTDD
jgi:hypothetical protein